MQRTELLTQAAGYIATGIASYSNYYTSRAAIAAARRGIAYYYPTTKVGRVGKSVDVMPRRQRGRRARWDSRTVRRRQGRRMRRRTRSGAYRRSGYYTSYGRTYNRSGTAPQELKFFDNIIVDSLIAAGGTIANSSLVLIPAGTTESTRIGRKCVVRKIAFRWVIELIPTVVAAETFDVVRVIVYLDKQANGAAAGTTTILEVDDFQSYNRIENKNRIRILMDRVYSLNGQAGSGRGTTDTLSYGGYMIHDSWYHDCTLPIEYGGVAGNLAEIKSNNIGILLLSNEGNRTSFTGRLRIRFSDS